MNGHRPINQFAETPTCPRGQFPEQHQARPILALHCTPFDQYIEISPLRSGPEPIFIPGIRIGRHYVVQATNGR